jgi:hypothetical protein
MDIGAADAGPQDAYEHVVDTDARRIDILQPQSGFTLAFNQSFHGASLNSIALVLLDFEIFAVREDFMLPGYFWVCPVARYFANLKHGATARVAHRECGCGSAALYYWTLKSLQRAKILREPHADLAAGIKPVWLCQRKEPAGEPGLSPAM